MSAEKKYYTHVEPHLEVIKQWKQQGVTNQTIAEQLNISSRTLSRCAKEHKALKEAMDASVKELVRNIEFNGLYKRALGYKYKEIKRFITKDEHGNTFTKIEETEKEVPPDTVACIFSLKNLAPDRFSDKREMAHSMKQEDFDGLINSFEKMQDDKLPRK